MRHTGTLYGHLLKKGRVNGKRAIEAAAAVASTVAIHTIMQLERQTDMFGAKWLFLPGTQQYSSLAKEKSRAGIVSDAIDAGFVPLVCEALEIPLGTVCAWGRNGLFMPSSPPIWLFLDSLVVVGCAVGSVAQDISGYGVPVNPRWPLETLDMLVSDAPPRCCNFVIAKLRRQTGISPAEVRSRAVLNRIAIASDLAVGCRRISGNGWEPHLIHQVKGGWRRGGEGFNLIDRRVKKLLGGAE